MKTNSRIIFEVQEKITFSNELRHKYESSPLYTDFQNVGASSLSKNWNKSVDSFCNIQLDTVDDVLDKEDKIGLIKMDVEGHEWFVLKGAEKTIKKNKPIIIFEHNAVEDENDMDVIKLLKSYGYHDYYEIVDGWEYLKQYLDACPKYLRFLCKGLFIFSGKKIAHRIIRVNTFNNKQYPVIIAQAN